MIAQPMRSPAAPATAMQLSSRKPCARTCWKSGGPLPTPTAIPNVAPRMRPLVISMYSAPTPSRIPPGERDDRDADVVGEDLARERSLVVDGDAPVLPARARLADVLELGRHQAAGRARVAPRPVAAEERGAEEADGRDRDQADPLAHAAPVAAHDEVAQRSAAARRVVHGRARAVHESFQPTQQRIAGELPPRDREVGRGGAVRGAEPAHTVGAELRRFVARAVDEVLELGPDRRAFVHELV